VQTFLPYADFDRTAQVLDSARLGKQRVEALQVLRALTFPDYGWQRHPVVGMWRGYRPALVAYGQTIVREWTARGHPDRCGPQIAEFSADGPFRPPPWLGSPVLHRSHRSALVRKDPAYYGPLFPGVPDDLPYVWPAPSADPEPDAGPVAAWVVRAEPDVVAAFRKRGVVGLTGFGVLTPVRSGGRSSKGLRQLLRFAEDLAPGDRLVVPAGAALLTGTVLGPYVHDPDPPPPGIHHRRRASWGGEVPRSALRRPELLQDPQQVFALRGDEPILEEAARISR
jgi:hypothetical protein